VILCLTWLTVGFLFAQLMCSAQYECVVVSCSAVMLGAVGREIMFYYHRINRLGKMCAGQG
jgi:hypothetical protein